LSYVDIVRVAKCWRSVNLHLMHIICEWSTDACIEQWPIVCLSA